MLQRQQWEAVWSAWDRGRPTADPVATNMNDISDLAALCVEDLAQADLFDLVSCGSVSSTECGPGDKVGQMSRSPSPASCLEQEESFTSITLINGEQICLREGGGGEEVLGWGGGTGVSDSMDLNSILQAGVVERVAPVSSTSQLDLELDCSRAGLDRTPRTILASQLPGAVSLAGPGVLRRASPSSTLTVIQTAVQSLPATSDTANNNNSLLRSALQGKAAVLAGEPGELSGRTAVLATVKVSRHFDSAVIGLSHPLILGLITIC